MSVLSIEEFGSQLLSTGDLDPVYLAINSASLSPNTLSKLCLSYWCFYHLGAAAKMAESSGPEYWDRMMEAATYSPTKSPADAQEWPRGAERRHYRGQQAWQSMVELRGRYGTLDPRRALELFVGYKRPSLPMTYGTVAVHVQTHRGFGEWIAFKVADMAERVLDYPVDFGDCHLGIYKDPRQGAAVAWVQNVALGPQFPDVMDYKNRPWDYPITNDELSRMVQHYVDLFSKKSALGLSRPVNVQEVETIFCKYKSHLKGHYPLGKDTREIRHGLQGWGKLADKLAKGLPNG